ncbi:MAG: lipopolysaccharide biosynthesis protein [Clostridia bacterium]|nr:lipopolysaccharide biosynthesis protein [Clostridia bacterium]
MINLLYSGNGKVFDGVLTSTLSLVKRLENPRPLRVYLYTMTLTRVNPNYTAMGEEHARFIEKALQKHNPDTKVILCDVTDLYETHLKQNANEGCYCSPYTLLRLLADLTDMPNKLLYLDADIMLNKDVSKLYDMDIEEYEYAAANDHYGKFLINPGYINAGVLLFNMKKCRETGLFEKARELIRVKKLTFADQSAIIRSTTKRKLISQRFNDQKFLYKNTVIRHFSKRLFWLPYPHTENIKQWHVEKVHKKFKYHQFDDILNEYLELKAEFENTQKTE